MSVYLDRFLNVPPARLPDPNDIAEHPEELLHEIPGLLNRQHQVDEAGRIAGCYLCSKGNPDRLMAVLGHCLLREDGISIPSKPSRHRFASKPCRQRSPVRPGWSPLPAIWPLTPRQCAPKNKPTASPTACTKAKPCLKRAKQQVKARDSGWPQIVCHMVTSRA